MSQGLFDLGNTRLKAAPLRADGTVGEVVALDHRRDGLEAAVAAMLPGRFDVAHVASVAGEALRVELLQVLSRHCQRIAIARTPRRWHGLEIGYPDPSHLGVDRFLAMLAVVGPGAGPALVCGIGTALTIDLVDGQGVHRGGRIGGAATQVGSHGRSVEAARLAGEGRLVTAPATCRLRLQRAARRAAP